MMSYFGRALGLAALGALAFALAGLVPTASPGQQPSASGKPEVLFADEFTGPELDRTKWNVEVTDRPANDEQQDYVDSPEVLTIARGAEYDGADGAALVIRAVHRPTPDGPTRGRRHDFISGRINTRGKFQFAHGTAAARMKLPPGAGLWPAFWILGTGPWPATGEIDVMECVGDPSWTNVALHGPGYAGDTPLVRRFHFPDGQDANGWHVYSVDWTPELFVFKVDDREFYRVSKAMVEKHGRWAYDQPKFLILNLALGGGYPAAVNKVKEPYLGLPAESVARIKGGAAKVLIDWVRVTKN
jgi:beta-glucanase (GH16 family)